MTYTCVQNNQWFAVECEMYFSGETVFKNIFQFNEVKLIFFKRNKLIWYIYKFNTPRPWMLIFKMDYFIICFFSKRNIKYQFESFLHLALNILTTVIQYHIPFSEIENENENKNGGIPMTYTSVIGLSYLCNIKSILE